METYKVKVFTPGHKLVFKGKVVRSPVTFSKLKKDDVKIIETQMRASSLKYTISKDDDILPKNQPIIEEINLDDDVEVEELVYKEPSTILEKLIAEDSE